MHAVQEDGRRRWVGIRDLDHRDTAFVLFAGVSLEAGPGLGAGDELFETREELTAVADTEGKCIGALEECLEFLIHYR